MIWATGERVWGRISDQHIKAKEMKLKKKLTPENKNFCEAKLVISINSVNTDCYDLLGG